MDSIYVLWKELTETSNDVTAVYFLTPENIYSIRNRCKIYSLTHPSKSELIASKIPYLCEVIHNETRQFSWCIVPYDISKVVHPDSGSNHSCVLSVKWETQL